MMFAMVGTNPYSFDRMVRPLDMLAGKYHWDIHIQLGHTDYIPVNCRYTDFITREKMLEYIDKSNVVICHGGFGSIRDALAFNKPVVAIPRRPEFNESQDYQEEMVREMEKDGYVIAVYDIEGLESAIISAQGFVPEKRPESRIPGLIEDFMYG